MNGSRSNTAAMLFRLAEFFPLIVFSFMGRSGAQIEDRFVVAAATAVLVIGTLSIFRWRFNPLLIAANIWLCLEAVAFLIRQESLMRLIGALREAAFFVALLIVGTLFVAVSRDGLLTRSGLARDRVLVRSFLLLGLIALALIWSFFWLGNEVVAAVIPATILFLAQSLLSASKDD